MSESLTKSEKLASLWLKVLEIVTPPPRYTVSEWAEKFRYLSREYSAQPGRYSLSVVPYAKDPMDCANDATVREVVAMWASQTTKTTMLENVMGFFIAAEPSPILLVQPSVEMAQAWSKERFVATCRDTPALRELVTEQKSRTGENTIQLKTFPGGNLAIIGSNAPSGLAGRPRRVVLLDEVDRFPASAGTEGDPVALAVRRTESFWNSVIYLTSTPTTKGLSRIESEFEQTDKRYWFCPCPHCGEHQTLVWRNVRWDEGKPETAYYQCESCPAKWTDEDRVKAIKAGQWRATAEFKGKRGYHLNGIYSPFKAKRGFKNRLHQMAVDFLEANAGGVEQLKTWTNTFLAETFEEGGTRIEAGEIALRREDYPILPEQSLVLTWGADVQSDRIEAEIVAWGIGEESWGIKRGYFLGDPNKSDEVWRQLYDFIQTKFKHPIYGEMQPKSGCVDTGYATAAAYAFVKRCASPNVWPVKGSSNKLRELVQAPNRKSRSQALLVDTGEFKSVIYSRLKIITPGPRMMHFPREYDDEYFAQLTAEKFIKKYVKGVIASRWENIRVNKRNEALDIRVYNHAALHLLNVTDWERLQKNLELRAESQKALEEQNKNNPILPVPEIQQAKTQPKKIYPIKQRKFSIKNW